MTTRKTYTPAQMRELADGRGSQFLMDDMRGALRYAADLIDAADNVIEENRRELAKRNIGVPAFDATKPCLLTTADPTRTYCERCKNPHHACDRDTPPYGVAPTVPSSLHKAVDALLNTINSYRATLPQQVLERAQDVETAQTIAGVPGMVTTPSAHVAESLRIAGVMASDEWPDCPECKGMGFMDGVGDRCAKCKGTGRIEPAGVAGTLKGQE